MLTRVYTLKTHSEGQRLHDWLHPCHGPFPELAAVYEDEDGQYLAAAWFSGEADNPTGWIIAIEGPHHDFLQTYFWKLLNPEYRVSPALCHSLSTQVKDIDSDLEDSIEGLIKTTIEGFKLK